MEFKKQVNYCRVELLKYDCSAVQIPGFGISGPDELVNLNRLQYTCTRLRSLGKMGLGCKKGEVI